MRAFDIRLSQRRAITASIGLLAGVSRIDQDFHEAQTPNRTSTVFILGPIGQLDVPLWRRVYARIEAAPVTYFVRTGDMAEDEELDTPVLLRAGAGIGVFF